MHKGGNKGEMHQCSWATECVCLTMKESAWRQACSQSCCRRNTEGKHTGEIKMPCWSFGHSQLSSSCKEQIPHVHILTNEKKILCKVNKIFRLLYFCSSDPLMLTGLWAKTSRAFIANLRILEKQVRICFPQRSGSMLWSSAWTHTLCFMCLFVCLMWNEPAAFDQVKMINAEFWGWHEKELTETSSEESVGRNPDIYSFHVKGRNVFLQPTIIDISLRRLSHLWVETTSENKKGVWKMYGNKIVTLFTSFYKIWRTILNASAVCACMHHHQNPWITAAAGLNMMIAQQPHPKQESMVLMSVALAFVLSATFDGASYAGYVCLTCEEMSWFHVKADSCSIWQKDVSSRFFKSWKLLCSRHPLHPPVIHGCSVLGSL